MQSKGSSYREERQGGEKEEVKFPVAKIKQEGKGNLLFSRIQAFCSRSNAAC